MQMFQLIKGSCADEAVGYCPKACFRGCGKGHPLMEGAPESMGLPELLGQEGSGRILSGTPPAPSLSASQCGGRRESVVCLPLLILESSRLCL